MCCNDLLVLHVHLQAELKLLLPFLQPQDLPDLLHITVNCLNPSAAQAVLQYVLSPPAAELQQLTKQQTAQIKAAPSQRRRGVLMLFQGRMQVPPPAKELKLQHKKERQDLWEKRQQLKQQLTTCLVEELLLTAAVRGHTQLVQQLCGVPAAQQMSADTAGAVLRYAVKHNDEDTLDSIVSDIPAVQHVTGTTAAQLMHLALDRSFNEAWPHLINLPAASTIPAAQMVSLMKYSIQADSRIAITALCQLPAAANIIGAGCIVQLLQMAVVLGDHCAIKVVGHLPTASSVAVSQWASLLLRGLRQGADTFSTLVKVPAVQQLHGAHLVEVCQAVVQTGFREGLELLLALPGAQHIQPAGIMQAALCHGVHHDPRSSIFQRLCLHSSAQNVTAGAVVNLIKFVVSFEAADNDHKLISKLCMLRAAKQLAAPAVFSLMMSALQASKPAAAGVLLGLLGAAAAQMDSSSISSLLQAVVAQGDAGWKGEGRATQLLKRLCSSRAAEQVSSSCLGPLIYQVISRGLLIALAPLCSLTVFVALQEADAVAILQLAMHHSHPVVMGMLTHALSAHSISPTAVAQVLRTGMQKCSIEASCTSGTHATSTQARMKQLYQLSAAQHIASADILDILQTAMQLPNNLNDAGTHTEVHLIELVDELCKLTPTRNLGPAEVAGLMQTAVQKNKLSMLLQLRLLPAAAHISTATALGLLQSAVEVDARRCFAILCHLPAVQQLNSQQICSIIELSLRLSCSMGLIERACGLQQVGKGLQTLQVLTSQDAGDLLQQSLQHYTSEVTQLLTKLPAAQSIPTEKVLRLLKLAVELDDAGEHLKVLGQLPAAKLVSMGDLSSLLQVAYTQGCSDVQEQLSNMANDIGLA